MKKDFKTLISDLNSNDWKIRYDAVLALCERKCRVAICHLIKAFKDRNKHVRGCIAEYIWLIVSKKKDKDIIKALELALKDRDYYVRIVSMESLMRLGSSSSIFKIKRRFLYDSSPLVRGYAASALGELGNRQVISVLEKVLKHEKANCVKLRIYISLLRLGEKEIFNNIVQMLFTRSYRNRCAVVNSLDDLMKHNRLKLDREQVVSIKKNIEKLIKREKTRAVKTNVKRFLRTIKEYENSYPCKIKL